MSVLALFVLPAYAISSTCTNDAVALVVEPAPDVGAYSTYTIAQMSKYDGTLTNLTTNFTTFAVEQARSSPTGSLYMATLPAKMDAVAGSGLISATLIDGNYVAAPYKMAIARENKTRWLTQYVANSQVITMQKNVVNLCTTFVTQEVSVKGIYTDTMSLTPTVQMYMKLPMFSSISAVS